MKPEKWFREMLAPAGIVPNGPNPYDPQIHNPQLYRRAKWEGTLGLGNAYVEGWWDCDRIDEFVCRALQSNIVARIGWSLPVLVALARARLMNEQSLKRSSRVGEQHYDLSSDLFAAMLGPSMAYSCGYWKNATTLDEAQYAKYDLICRKLYLEEDMLVLDIGCGWGGLAKFMAEHYGVRVIGLTISKNQAIYARELCQGLPIDIRLQDYRTFNKKVDRVVSVGMLEHVGPKNYATFMKIVRTCLGDDGLCLLHTIGNPVTSTITEPWMESNIFPGGRVPALQQLSRSMEGQLIVEDLHNFGSNYDPTLMSWLKKYVDAWPRFKHIYNETSFRKWTLYLPGCAGTFRSRNMQLWQLALSPHGVQGGYQPIR